MYAPLLLEKYNADEISDEKDKDKFEDLHRSILVFSILVTYGSLLIDLYIGL